MIGDWYCRMSSSSSAFCSMSQANDPRRDRFVVRPFPTLLFLPVQFVQPVFPVPVLLIRIVSMVSIREKASYKPIDAVAFASGGSPGCTGLIASSSPSESWITLFIQLSNACLGSNFNVRAVFGGQFRSKTRRRVTRLGGADIGRLTILNRYSLLDSGILLIKLCH